MGRFPGQFFRRTELIKRSLLQDEEPAWWCLEPLLSPWVPLPAPSPGRQSSLRRHPRPRRRRCRRRRGQAAASVPLLTPATNTAASHATVARPPLRSRPRPRHGHCQRRRRCRRRRRTPVRHCGGRRRTPHCRGLAAAAALRLSPAPLSPPPPQRSLSRCFGAFLSPPPRVSRGLPMQSWWG